MHPSHRMNDLLADRKAVLFDIDGTLVASNNLHAEAWAKVLRRHGYRIDAKKIVRFIGKGSDKLLAELLDIKDQKMVDALSAERSEVFCQDYAPRITALPAARELLSACRRLGLKVVAATAASQNEFRAITEAAGLADVLTLATTSSDAAHSKPDPDVVLAALDLVKVGPDEALMVGDTPYDIEAGHKAGVEVIAFRSGGWTDASLKGAALIMDGPAGLVQELEAYS